MSRRLPFAPRLAGLALALLASLLPAALAAQIPRAEYAARRDSVARRMGDGVLLVPGAPEPAFDYIAFHQDPTFEYLTGVRESDATLLLVRRGGTTTSLLFVEPTNPAREVWSGYRLGLDGARALTGMETRLAGTLAAVLDSVVRGGGPLHLAGLAATRFDGNGGGGSAGSLLERLRAGHPRLDVRDASTLVRTARAFKSPAELDLIARAVQITTAAHRDAMRLVAPGMNEFEVQALVEYTFRRYGADRPGFASIVGSGPNSTILHYNRNDRFMQAGETVVIDIGASYRGYTADVTRTLPVSGTFTPEQRAVYQIVRDAQAAAERQARVGGSFVAMGDSARAVLAAGLARLGLIESPDATYACGADRRCPQLALYFMHGLGHGIGLQVHDPDQYEITRELGVGSVFTIEPGLYVRANVVDVIPDTPANRALRERLRPVVRRYANIGVRIEDDYEVTRDGLTWLSRGVPREPAEVEAMMREPYAGPAARDTTMVEWYRRTAPPR